MPSRNGRIPLSQFGVKSLDGANLAMCRQAELVSLFSLTVRLYRASDAVDIYNAQPDAKTDILNSKRVSILLFDPNGIIKFAARKALLERYVSEVEGLSPWLQGQSQPDCISVEDIQKPMSLNT